MCIAVYLLKRYNLVVLCYRNMDCYFPLPINERKLQEIVHDAKDFVYGLGKEVEKDSVHCPKIIRHVVVIVLFIYFLH